jgi:2,4-dienoyl-CoA reductase-like NADH-dependent reductase (Old Yellow Enzyme family)
MLRGSKYLAGDPARREISMVVLGDPLVLASGAVLPNRIARAATEENLAAGGQAPGRELARLYRRWSAGGAGLLGTGHVMIDSRALPRPALLVLLDERFRRARARHRYRAWLPGHLATSGREAPETVAK